MQQQNGYSNGYANGHQDGFHSIEEGQEQLSSAQGEQVKASEQMMTHAVSELLGALRKATPPLEKGQGINGTTLKPVSIKRQEQVLYGDKWKEQPFRNQLSLTDVDYLQHLLKQSPGSRIGGPEENIEIRVAGQSIFQAKEGIVTVNELPPPPQQQNSHTLEQGQFYGGAGVATIPPTLLVHNSMSLEQGQEQTESLLERLDKANEVSQSSSREPWMKQSLSERVKQKTARLFSSIRKNRAADTAIDLLQQRGKSEQGEFVYDAEQYRFRGLGRHVLVEDREGRGLMTIKTGLFGRPKITRYSLNAEQEADFLKVRATLQEQGIKGFSNDPIVRSKQMGGLAPQGDAKITADLKAFSVSDVARDWIKAGGSQPDPTTGKRVLDGQQYRIEVSPNSLIILAKGRGQIFSQKDGKITSNLTDADTKHFVFVAKELAALQKQRQAVQQKPQTVRMR